MSVTLESVIASEDDFIKELLESQGFVYDLMASSDTSRLEAAIIYHNLGMLTPEDEKLVENPDFTPLFHAYHGDMTTIRQKMTPIVNPPIIVTQTATLPALVYKPPTTNAAPIIDDEEEDDVDTVDEADDVETANKPLVKIFKDLATYHRLIGETFKSSAFLKVSNSIKNLAYKIVNDRDATGIIGVGKSSMDIIIDYLRTGKSSRLETVKTENKAITDVLELFCSIHGVGPVKAVKLYEAGCRTLEDVGKQKLTKAQVLGVTYYYHLKERIPREEVDEIFDYIGNTDPNDGYKIFSSDNVDLRIAGSYRRGEATCGDIDIVLKSSPGVNIEAAVKILRDSGILIGALAQGPRKFMGIVKLPDVDGVTRLARRLDIRLFNPEEWAYALMYNTGSQQFNILMRRVALAHNLSLNEYGMTSLENGDPHPANTEADIFRYLSLKYLPPEGRLQTLQVLHTTLGL